jgi:magnesium transporter
MNSIFVHRDGRTEQVTSIDRNWLGPTAGVYLWVDLAAPSIPESLVLSDTFAFHRLAVDDALASTQTPKIETYDDYLFAGMAGADADVSYLVGSYFIVSVHWHESKAVADLIDSVQHGGKHFVEGPVAMFHRLADATVDGFGAVVERLASCAGSIEQRLLEKASADLVREALQARRETFALTQRLSRQQQAVDRLARRDVVAISPEMAFRFRDVRDRLIRLTDDSLAIEHRLGDLLTAAASLASSRRWM